MSGVWKEHGLDVIARGGGPRQLQRIFRDPERALLFYARAMKGLCATPAEPPVCEVTGDAEVACLATCHWRAWIPGRDDGLPVSVLFLVLLAPPMLLVILPLWLLTRRRQAATFTSVHWMSEIGARRARRALWLEPLLRGAIQLVLFGAGMFALTALLCLMLDAFPGNPELVFATFAALLLGIAAGLDTLRRFIMLPPGIQPRSHRPFRCCRIELAPGKGADRFTESPHAR